MFFKKMYLFRFKREKRQLMLYHLKKKKEKKVNAVSVKKRVNITFYLLYNHVNATYL